MKEIILSTELMAFFILNMFGHDSALHDFTTSSSFGKSRVVNVLRSHTPLSPGTGSGSFNGRGGGVDTALNASTKRFYESTVAQSLYNCLQTTGFFDITRNDIKRSDSFIIVDAKLAMGPVFTGEGIKNMGIAPGFIYLPERTYSPFEFVVNNRSRLYPSGFAESMVSYQHHTDPSLIIEIHHRGTFGCVINRNGNVTAYNLLSSVSGNYDIIATNPHVSDAFMSNTVLTSITNYVDYVQLLLDGAAFRYEFILRDYIDFGCSMNSDETAYVNNLITKGKKHLVNTITGFWNWFYSLELTSQSLTSMLPQVPHIFIKINEIQAMFDVIYKAILCSIGTAVKAGLYSCAPPSITRLSDINNFYRDNKSQLERFVYGYMISSIDGGATGLKDLKVMCNSLIKTINDNLEHHLNQIVESIVSNTDVFRDIFTRLSNLSTVYNLQLSGPPDLSSPELIQLFLTQYPRTYFVNLETPADTSNAEQLTTFINFLQIISDIIIDKETDKEEIQEQEENEVVYVDNLTTTSNEAYIYELTNLPIIKEDPTKFNAHTLTELKDLNRYVLTLLFDNKSKGNPGYDPTKDPDYAIILTDAVGSVYIHDVHSLLSLSSPVESLAYDKIQIAAELLQTVFLGLINRLDSDQLTELVTRIYPGGLGQSGGAQKKPEYLFVFQEAYKFFTQLISQNRITKMKAKFKELCDNTNVLPAFYTDLIIQPNFPNALDWKINFKIVFFGFFENVANPDITASIDSGVIFPQIPSTVIDTLTLDNVLTGRPAFDRTKIVHLSSLGDSWFSAYTSGVRPDHSGIFIEILQIIKDLNLPGIFVEPDEDSDIFWKFEQGYIYLLKCVVLYGVLFFPSPSGTGTGIQTLNTNGFIASSQAIYPDQNDDKFKYFLLLFFSCTKRYSELLTKIDELVATSSELSNTQKICTGYALGSILTSVMTEMRPIISSFKNSALLNIETTEISRILAKKANTSTILQSSTFGDNDTKLYNKFINWVDNNNAQREANTVFSHSDNISGKLSDSLTSKDAKWNKSLVRDISSQYGGSRKFYINNAVNAPSALGKLGQGYFCPAASIMDNQSTCSTKTSAEANEGFEVGVMDFVIHDGRPFGQSTGIPHKMIYRVRVVPLGDRSVCKIGAYLSIENKVLINVADEDIFANGGADWPRTVAPHPPITVSLNARRGDIIPMDAKTCLTNIFATIDSKAFEFYNTRGFQSLIDDLEKPGEPSLSLRRLILESSFVKGLGDFLQEVSGFVDNSGYETTPFIIPSIIRPPNEGRLQLNNDRPSSVRAILLVLYGKGAINPNVIAGFLTEMKDKQKIPKSKYALAGRLIGGGGRKTKKTKASKRNKNTRRIKMKTRMNKRSNRQKRLKVRKTRKVLK